jgi:hypothetical protein
MQIKYINQNLYFTNINFRGAFLSISNCATMLMTLYMSMFFIENEFSLQTKIASIFILVLLQMQCLTLNNKLNLIRSIQQEKELMFEYNKSAILLKIGFILSYGISTMLLVIPKFNFLTAIAFILLYLIYATYEIDNLFKFARFVDQQNSSDSIDSL